MWSRVTNLTLALILLLIMVSARASADALPFNLRPTFTRDARVCRALYDSPAASLGCRAYDVKCPGKMDANRIETGPLDANGFVGTNAYGYTEIHDLSKGDQQEETEKSAEPDALTATLDALSNALPKGRAVVFLGRFEGDNRPRLLEIWEVDASSLQDLKSMPLPPKEPGAMFVDRNRNAEFLEDLLKRGGRLSSEWSPLVLHGGRIFFIERECSGQWVYGGFYVCNRIIKLTFKRIDASGATAYCQLSAPPRARHRRQ